MSSTTIVQVVMEAITTFVYHVIDLVLDAYIGLDLAMQLLPNSIGWWSQENYQRMQKILICLEPVVTFRRRARQVVRMAGRP